MRLFLRFPELLILIAMLVAPAIVPNTTFLVQYGDKHTFFGKTPWGFSSIFIPIDLILLITWATHLLTRKYKGLPAKWRWGHIVVTLISITVMVRLMWSPLLWMSDTPFANYSTPAWEKLQKLECQLTWSIELFSVTQAVFYIVALTALTVSLVRHRLTPSNQ